MNENPYYKGEGSSQKIGGNTEAAQMQQVKSGQYKTTTAEEITDTATDRGQDAGAVQQAGPDLSFLNNQKSPLSTLMDIAKTGTNLYDTITTDMDDESWKKYLAEKEKLDERAADEGWSVERKKREQMVILEKWGTDKGPMREDLLNRYKDERKPLLEEQRRRQLELIEESEDATVSIALDDAVQNYQDYPESYTVDADPIATLSGTGGPTTVIKPDVTQYGTDPEALEAVVDYVVHAEFNDFDQMSTEKQRRIKDKARTRFAALVSKMRTDARAADKAMGRERGDVISIEADPTFDRADPQDAPAVSDEYRKTLSTAIEAPDSRGVAVPPAEQRSRALKTLNSELQKIYKDDKLTWAEREARVEALLSDEVWPQYLGSKADPDASAALESVRKYLDSSQKGTPNSGPTVTDMKLEEFGQRLDRDLRRDGMSFDANHAAGVIKGMYDMYGVDPDAEPGTDEYRKLQRFQKVADEYMAKAVDISKANAEREAAEKDWAEVRRGKTPTKDQTEAWVNDNAETEGLRRLTDGFDMDKMSDKERTEYAIGWGQYLGDAVKGINPGDSKRITDFISNATLQRDMSPQRFKDAVAMMSGMTVAQQRNVIAAIGDADTAMALRQGMRALQSRPGLEPSDVAGAAPVGQDMDGVEVDDAGRVILDMDSKGIQESLAELNDNWESAVEDHPMGSKENAGWFESFKTEGKLDIDRVNADPVFRDMFIRARQLVASGLDWNEALTRTFTELDSTNHQIVFDGDSGSRIIHDPKDHLGGDLVELDDLRDRQLDSYLSPEQAQALADKLGLELDPDTLRGGRVHQTREILRKGIAAKLTRDWGKMDQQQQMQLMVDMGVADSAMVERFNNGEPTKEDLDRMGSFTISEELIPPVDEWDWSYDTNSPRGRAYLNDDAGGLATDFSIELPGGMTINSKQLMRDAEGPAFVISRSRQGGSFEQQPYLPGRDSEVAKEAADTGKREIIDKALGSQTYSKIQRAIKRHGYGDKASTDYINTRIKEMLETSSEGTSQTINRSEAQLIAIWEYKQENPGHVWPWQRSTVSDPIPESDFWIEHIGEGLSKSWLGATVRGIGGVIDAVTSPATYGNDGIPGYEYEPRPIAPYEPDLEDGDVGPMYD